MRFDCRLIVLVLAATIFEPLAPPVASPRVRLWQWRPLSRAAYEAYFQAELEGPENMSVSRPDVRLTEGKVERLAISPNHRRSRFSVTNSGRGPNARAGATNMVVAFPFGWEGRRGEAAVTASLHFYQTGGLSVGPSPLPGQRQKPVAFSGDFQGPEKPVAVARSAEVVIEADRADTVASPLGNMIVFYARPSRRRGAETFRCARADCSWGKLVTLHFGATRQVTRPYQFWYTPVAGDSSMREGALTLSFTFEIKRHNMSRKTNMTARVIVGPDGTSRVVKLTGKQARNSPPQHAQVRGKDDLWVPVAAAGQSPG